MDQPGTLELILNGDKVESIKIFSKNDVEEKVKELKKAYYISDEDPELIFDYEFWLVFKSSMKETIIKK